MLILPLWLVKTATMPARQTTVRKMASASKQEKEQQFAAAGKHLTIDAYGITPERLRDSRAIYNLLDDLPGQLGMTKLTTPQIAFVQQPNRTGHWGISGFVMICESHIALHTWPENGYVSMDVYSCKDFDHKVVIQRLTEHWGALKVNARVIARG